MQSSCMTRGRLDVCSSSQLHMINCAFCIQRVHKTLVRCSMLLRMQPQKGGEGTMQQAQSIQTR
jgi:hypothetical protein